MRQSFDTLTFDILYFLKTLLLLKFSFLLLDIGNSLTLQQYLLLISIHVLHLLIAPRVHERTAERKVWLNIFNLDSYFLDGLALLFVQLGQAAQVKFLHILQYATLVDEIMIEQVHVSCWVKNLVQLNNILLN